MNIRVPALLRLARGQPCCNCGAEDDTTVAAHSNWAIHGKGKSLKAHDIFHAHLCYRCHSWLDQGSGHDPTGVFGDGRADKIYMFRLAMEKTWIRLWQSGKIKVA